MGPAMGGRYAGGPRVRPGGGPASHDGEVMEEKVRVVHFSDVLCVWAYVSQARMDELRRNFAPETVAVEFRFLSVFGDAHGKIRRQWAERGAFRGYADHVRAVVQRFGHVPLHPRVWEDNAPRSSLPAHLFLCAARLLEAREETGLPHPGGPFERAAWELRRAFFEEHLDVGRRQVLLEVGERAGLPVTDVQALMDDGRAQAALAADLELARELAISASPTLVFNEGRQRLTGNVGYRIIEANIRELLENPSGQHSWC